MMPCARDRAATSRICAVVVPLFIFSSTSSDPDSAPQNTIVSPARLSSLQVSSEKRVSASTRASHHHRRPSGAMRAGELARVVFLHEEVVVVEMHRVHAVRRARESARCAAVRAGACSFSRLPNTEITPQNLQPYGQPIDAW